MENEENTMTEDVDVGENFIQEDVKPDIRSMRKKKGVGPRRECPYGCAKLLAPRTIDYHRTNGCRVGTEEPLGDTTKKRNHCCGVCYSEFVTRKAFFEHLRQEHDVRAEVHRMDFDNRDLFDRFVKWVEMEGGAHFRLKSGSKKRANGRGIFMACNRSGFVGPSEVDPLKNRTGPYRTGYSCTAFINGCEYNDGTISVDVCGDHYGHDARMRLPNVIKQLIAQKQLDGESSLDIISFLKRHFEPLRDDNIYAQRICLVDQDELRTLMASYTKRWEATGIPQDFEIWEEELLDSACIQRSVRLRDPSDPTTQQIADQLGWPRPAVFVAKLRTDDGFIELLELQKSSAESRRLASIVQRQSGVYHDFSDDLSVEHPDGGSSSIITTSYDEMGQPVMEYNMGQGVGSSVQYSQADSPGISHSQGRGRKGMVHLISNEMEMISRELDCNLSHVSNKALVSVLTRLKSARSILHSACETARYRGNRIQNESRSNGAYAYEGSAPNGEMSEDILERQDQPEYVNILDVKGNPPEDDVMLEAVENVNDLSDDESIVNHVHCVDFKSSLWN